MARWEPDARGRMIRAALELFAERGFERTTAGEIAERAGVTERTFFRHFSDKREVLFDGSELMQQRVHDTIVGAESGSAPLDTAVAGMVAAAHALPAREYAVRRAEVIGVNAALRERELLKLATMRAVAADALRERDIAEPAATLAAHSAVTIFSVAFEQWIDSAQPGQLAEYIADTATALRSLL